MHLCPYKETCFRHNMQHVNDTTNIKAVVEGAAYENFSNICQSPPNGTLGSILAFQVPLGDVAICFQKGESLVK